jgi:GT2 family glycosyltransferase
LIAVIVLNWNRWEETLACLQALDEVQYTRRFAIVVDNASSDGSASRIREARPDVELLESDCNRGYAGGNNLGIRRALERGADIVWILNNDTRADAHALSALVEAIPGSDWGMLASSLLDPGTRHVNVSARVDKDDQLVPIVCAGCEAGYHTADALMGASLFIRREVLEAVGLLDERYFHYFEERDFVERARRSGWSLGLACRSLVAHEAGRTLAVSSPQATYYFVRNQLLYERRFLGRHPLRSVAADSIAIRRHLALRHAVRFRDFRGIVATVLGIRDAVRDRTGFRDLGERFASPLGWA